MANMDVGQLRALLRSMPANRQVKIQAGTLLGLIELVKTLQGSEAVLPLSPVPTQEHVYDLTRWGG